MTLYHYTSRLYAQDIACTGQLIPGKSGLLYLSSHLYTSGIDAADSLGLTSKPIEIGIEIDLLTGVASAPTPVGPFLGPNGIILRKGGGEEVTMNTPVGIAKQPKWISLIEP